jgi:carbamoyltransferase
MNILGLSCYNRESAACLLIDGQVAAAAMESSFTRDTTHSVFPAQAMNFCLQYANKTIIDVDYIVIPEKPYLKFERELTNHIKAFPCSLIEFINSMPSWLEDRLIIPLKLKKDFAFDGKVMFIKHHLAHASGAFYISPFEKSAILTADGAGECATLTTAFGEGKNIRLQREIKYPNSLGLLYAAITNYLGFEAFKDEDKVMTLAGHGKPIFIDKLRMIVKTKPDGSFMVNEKYFNYLNPAKLYRNKLTSLLGKERFPKDDIQDVHCDIAASLQCLVEDILVGISLKLHETTQTENLCLSGGIFNNSNINKSIVENTPYKQVFIQPAPGNCSTVIGAAAYIYLGILGNQRNSMMKSPYLGPEFSQTRIMRLLTNKGANFKEVDPELILKLAAEKISQNKILGWFQGRMELGNYGLGNRNILANPCSKEMKILLDDRLGYVGKIKAYGVSILEEEVQNFFEKSHPSPYKSLSFKVKDSMKDKIPSAYHADGTVRIQTLTKKDKIIYHDLVREFQKMTSVPMVLSTSFKDKNGILVSTPEEAYDTFESMNLDALVIGNFLVERK